MRPFSVDRRWRTLNLPAWIASGSGRGIGTRRGTRGRSVRSASPWSLPAYLVWSFLIVAIEGSDHYLETASVTVGTVLVMSFVTILPGLGQAPPCRAMGSRPRGRSGEGTGGHLRLFSPGWRPSGGRQRCLGRPAIRRCRRDRRSDWVAGSSSTRSWVPSVGISKPADRCSQLGGSNTATGQGRHRR